ncbi:hypothetical protein AS97_35825 [Streptomyces sp. AgN23]|nr:hypothetical protein AS97_35825 [Streptomyces sp. AgN23]
MTATTVIADSPAEVSTRNTLSETREAQLVAEGRPLGGGVEIADVVGHEGRPGREDRQVDAAFVHQPELVRLDAVAQLVVTDAEIGAGGGAGGVGESADLLGAPCLQRRWRGGVVAMAVDGHSRFLLGVWFLAT